MASTPLEQMGPEGRRINAPPTVAEFKGKLFYFGNRLCPFAHRAWWSLLEKGVEDFVYIHIDLGDAKPEWYQKQVNEFGTVPCVFDDGKPVYESLICSEYLDDRFHGRGTALLPDDPFARSQARLICSIWADKIQGLCYRMLTNQDRSKDEELKQSLATELKKLNDRLAPSSEGPYALGKDLSLADIAIVPFLDRFSATLSKYRGFDVFTPSTARLQEVYEACKKRPAFEKTRQPPEFYIRAYENYSKGTPKVV